MKSNQLAYSRACCQRLIQFTPSSMSSTTTLTAHPMAKGKSIPEAIRWVIIRLSTAMTTKEISMYMDKDEQGYTLGIKLQHPTPTLSTPTLIG